MGTHTQSAVTSSAALQRTQSPLANRWVQLGVGIVAMVAVANLQYGWTLFVEPLHQRFHWSKAQIQFAFTLFVLAETWLVPLEGYLIDRLGPTVMVSLGGLLVGLAWVLNAWTESLALLYLAAVVGGAGAGIVYGASMGNAIKWFLWHRGLAAGLTAAAFGAGSALTVWPITYLIATRGYQTAFFWFGLGQGGLVVIMALLQRAPRAEIDTETKRQGNISVSPSPLKEFTWRQMMRTPVFWLMYSIMTMVTVGGLMAVAQLGPMAQDYGVADVPVRLLGFEAAALPFAMALDRALNGLTRPFFGWVSDRLGRENTMFVAFGLEGIAILFLVTLAHIPVFFVLLSGLTFFAWGEVFSLFPALCGDIFGRKFAATNYGLLYTAKGMAALLVPLGSLLREKTGTWITIFAMAVALDFLAAVLALFVLKPIRLKLMGCVADPSTGLD